MERRGALQHNQSRTRRGGWPPLMTDARPGKKSNISSPSRWLYSRCWVVLLLFNLCCPILCLPQDDAVITASTEQCNTVECLESVRDALQCSESDLGCMCDTADFISDLSTCISSDLQCSWTFAAAASSEIESQCEPYTSSAWDLCLECFSSQAKKRDCFGLEDLGCMCGGNPTEYESLASSCLTSFSKGSITCPEASVDIHLRGKTLDCDDYISTAKFDGCLTCQVSIATEVGCAGRDDFGCLCSVDDFTDSLSSCIETKCFPEDQTLAFSRHMSSCLVFTPEATDGEPALATAGGLANSTKEDGDEDGDEDGPDTTTVIGAVVGTVAGLSLLLTGGYFIFRKRSKGKKSNKIVPSKVQEQSDASVNSVAAVAEAPPTGKQGMYEVEGSRQHQHFPATTPYALHEMYEARIAPSELNGQQLQHPRSTATELDSRPRHFLHNDGLQYGSSNPV